jgi:hypothetical protein
MPVKYAKIIYMHCHISLFLQATSEKNHGIKNYSDITLHLLLQKQILEDIIKGDFKGDIFIKD